MSSKKNRQKTVKNAFLKMILASIAAFALGYYLLNFVSTSEDPPLGNTFYIIVGCILIAAALLLLGYNLKMRYFPAKRKKKSSRPVFLNDIQNKDKL